MGGKGSGRPIKYNDRWHENVRKAQRRYIEKNREAVNLARKLNISIEDARQILKQKKRVGMVWGES